MSNLNWLGSRFSVRRFVRPLLATLAAAAALLPTALPAATGAKPAPVQASKPKAMPTFEAVKAAISAQLVKANRHYKPGDVLAQSDAQAIFGMLASLGWEVSDHKEIVDQFLPDDYYLIHALRSRNNTPFMRQIGRVPNGYGYDRLDRISRMGDGQILVSRIMQAPGGWRFVDIMSETREARGLAQAFSMGPGGKDFKKPTGRIYTEEQFVTRLKQSYEKDKKEKSPPPAKTYPFTHGAEKRGQ